MRTFFTGCHEDRRTMEKFSQWVEIGGKSTEAEFEKQVVWLRETETVLVYTHGGVVLQTGATHNDFYGYLTSFKNFGAEKVAAHYGVTPKSSLEIELRTTIFDNPCIEDKECAHYNATKPTNYRAQYAYIPVDWRKKVIIDGETAWRPLEKKSLAMRTTWSSKNTPEQNEALAFDVHAQWMAVGTQLNESQPGQKG